jgi:hypothetical protein
MRLRCIEPKNAAYPSYGGRGITVCAAWLDSVTTFVLNMGPKPSPQHELDRRENDKGYWCGKCSECVAAGREPNCRWVLRKTNDRNRRSNRLLSHNGETLALAEWCERLGLPRDTIRKRLVAGWSIAETLETPVRAKLPNGAGRRDGRIDNEVHS